MILCIGTTPAAQRVMTFAKLELDSVNRARATRDGIAGKSINVAKVLGKLGAQPVATGFVGGDRGRAIVNELRERGIRSQFVSVPAPTRQCITVIDESAAAVTELVEESRAVQAGEYEALRSIIHQWLSDCQAVVMSGSLTPGGPLDFYETITRQANALKILSVIDAQGQPLLQALPARPGLVKPNRQELSATVGRPLSTESELISALQEVHRLGATRIVVTAGKFPSLAFDGENLWRITSPSVAVVNPIGSGDAFTAGLVWRLTLRESLGEACRWAAAAGAANALSPMPGDLERVDVERLAQQVKLERL